MLKNAEKKIKKAECGPRPTAESLSEFSCKPRKGWFCAACVFNCLYDAKNVMVNEAAAVCNAALAEVQLVS